ncbi:hypothetical protein AIF0345_2475 [Actinomyces israelii]|nr:hypothetical protein AIF0345_2475 [Actinomyces israelii]
MACGAEPDRPRRGFRPVSAREGTLAGVILGIGTDLVAVGRLEARLVSVPALAGRLFTPQERAACAGRATCLAGRFAAKEAVVKALGSALAEAGRGAPSGWRYTDVEVVSAPGAPPRLALHGVARATAAGLGVAGWRLSLTHDDGRALAFVIAEGGGEGPDAPGSRAAPGAPVTPR